jgi:hypothetical protein
VLEFAGAFFEDFELGLGESEHFFRIFSFIFFMMVSEAIGLFFDRRLRLMTQMDADNFDRFLGNSAIALH